MSMTNDEQDQLLRYIIKIKSKIKPHNPVKKSKRRCIK